MFSLDVRRLTHGRAVWAELLKAIQFGYQPEHVFEDWLDLALAAHLSLTDNFTRKGPRPGRLDGKYEDRTARISSQYREPLAIAALDAAYEALSRVVHDRGVDALGDIYPVICPVKTHPKISTPKIIRHQKAPRVLDAPCGSGRMLIATQRVHPEAELWGIDNDPVCAKMCALNMVVFGFRAVVIHGDAFAKRYRRMWRMSGGFISETDIGEVERPRANHASQPAPR